LEEDEDFSAKQLLDDEKIKQSEFWNVRDCPNVVQDLKNLG